MPGPAARLEPVEGGLPGLSIQTAAGDWIRLHGRRIQSAKRIGCLRTRLPTESLPP